MNWIWIKKNQNILSVTAVLLLALVCAIPVWLYQNEQRSKAASEAYYKAVQLIKKDDPESLKSAEAALQAVAIKHKNSKVARLAQLYAASISLKLGKADKAAGAYEAFLSQVSTGDKLKPIALQGLKSAYEKLGNTEKVKTLSAELAGLGF